MPAPVDREARRAQVAAVAADLVAAGGIDALTVRAVAQSMGLSTAVVSHYFSDKRDLLLLTCRAAAARSTARFETAVRARDPRLRRCLEALLPLDRSRRADWTLFYAFWALATSDDELAAEQRAHLRSARQRIERVVLSELAAGRCRPGIDPSEVARRLLVLVQGMGVQVVFDPRDWTPGRQRAFLARELRTVLDDVD